ncbi:uncharacterized protein N7459_000062 [Penicillium hispanicum]|uniref:uncharacterized protein n=1 Tax=Penicillium hispanicum TaxID=1080232 RepID=UPI002540C222|nr:uncharacterized protein N7459_000062 [Penicillium hispanicum]KAJ5593854.1 hypothetical protein N7459_000062 [Penicillium hispanicum]
MAAGGARAQKPVGSAAWIASEKENMTDLVNQEMEEVEYPVRHEMAWLNEHMAEIFSKGQANFTDVFKTPGKMRGKTPRTIRKRTAEENRVPLSEIFSSAHKNVENKASSSPFVHRVVSKSTAPITMTASARPQNAANVSQPQYPDLSQNLNSFSKYNTDSGYHGLTDEDEMVLPATQSDTQVSTQPMEVDEPVSSNPQVDISISQQTTEDSFHSAQENVRARGETVEPPNPDPTPTQERTMHLLDTLPKDSEPEMSLTPTAKTQHMSKANADPQKQQDRPGIQQETESKQEDAVVNAKSSPIKPLTTQALAPEEPENQDVEMEERAKEDAVLDGFDDIGSPSDGSTPERPLVRKSSLNFASLPAREPLTKSMGGSRLSRTSHIDLSKHNNSNRTSYLGRQIGGQRMTQAAAEGNAADSSAMAMDGEKEDDEDVDADQASKLHNTKSTQSLHERISMLGKLQPSRPKKSIPAMASLSGGQISYPDLPPPKSEARLQSSSPRTRETPAQDRDEDDWIKPLSPPQRSNLTKSNTTDVMEKLSEADKNQHSGEFATQEQRTAEPEPPKSSTSIFSSPRSHGHQQSASTSNIPTEASTTPTGSPRRFDGPLSASKTRLQSIMKTAKGLFTSTGSTGRVESSPSEQPCVQSQPHERTNAEMYERKPDRSGSQSRHISSPSPSRQEGRRTRSSTEKEEKRRQREREERQQEEELQQKLREQEKQRAMQLKVAQEKSSVEPEERTVPKPTQSQRQQSREPEPAYAGSRNAAPQSKLNDRRPKPTREPAQMPKPQPVSIRVGSTLSRQVPMASSVSSSVQDNVPASAPAPVSRQSNLKKKGSNTSLHTASSTSSFKTSVSSQTQAQRKAHLANERRREQEERELKRKEEQKREQERKRAVQQQQEEARRQEMRSRAETERERREVSAQEDPRKAAIKKRQLENARRHERQGSQQANREGPMLQHEISVLKSSQQNDPGASRPPSTLGSIQPYNRPINPPAPNPAKPPKRGPEEEASQRPAVRKPSNVHGTSEGKRLKTDDEPGLMQPVRAPMAPPVRHSNIRKEFAQPSLFNQTPMAHPTGSSIFKAAQPQRPAHPMVKYTNGKIPFAEPSQAPPPAAHKPSASSSVQRALPQAKPSPKYPSGENIHLPEIATDSEDEDDSDSEMFPVPKWAQPKELEGLLRQQDGMEVDSIFGPIAPFSLEETFKADKKIKKYRDRTSSANWSGPDGLTQEEIKKDRADRQRLRLNGGWSFQT